MIRHPDIDDVRAAAVRIAEIVRRTPLVRSAVLSEMTGGDVWLKLECEQETGSFKVRGAANALLQLGDDERSSGVVAVSSGNHGRAVAHVSRLLGIEATICISSRVPPNKVEAMEGLGAVVVVAGSDQDDADAAARRLVEERGATFIHPFDDPRVIAGQGTIGLEILAEIEPAELVIPLSGGGLAGGTAMATKALSADTHTVGVSQDRGPAMVRTLDAGHLIDVVEEDTLADALAGGLGPSNDHSVFLCSAYLDETVLVSEEEIAAAMALLHSDEGLAVEGGGAVGVAAVMRRKAGTRSPTVVVVSGGNVSEDTLRRILGRQ
jgi:threonine dehydratase